MKSTNRTRFLNEVELKQHMGVELSKDELVESVRSYVDVPDAEALKTQWLTRKVNSWMRGRVYATWFRAFDSGLLAK